MGDDREEVRPRKSKQITSFVDIVIDGSDLLDEELRLLNNIFVTLRSICLTARKRDYAFLHYLTEMAVLEVQKRIHHIMLDDSNKPKV